MRSFSLCSTNTTNIQRRGDDSFPYAHPTSCDFLCFDLKNETGKEMLSNYTFLLQEWRWSGFFIMSVLWLLRLPCPANNKATFIFLFPFSSSFFLIPWLSTPSKRKWTLNNPWSTLANMGRFSLSPFCFFLSTNPNLWSNNGEIKVVNDNLVCFFWTTWVLFL